MDSLCKVAASLMQKEMAHQENHSISNEVRSFGFLDIWEDKTKFLFCIDAPGLIKEEIDISISGNYLNVNASRKTTLQPDETLRYSERKNTIDRSILLPPNVNVDNISCIYKDGVIHITLSKLRPDENLVRKIPISYFVFSRNKPMHLDK